MKDSLKSVQSKRLNPILFSLALLFIIFFVLLNSLPLRDSEESNDAALQVARQVYENSINKQLNFIQLLAELAADNAAITVPLTQGDAGPLSQRFMDQYLTMRERHDITHFYFHTFDGVNVIRLHELSRRGDRIDRFTMREAIRTEQAASGVELGTRGTLTIRVVVPLRGPTGLVGFIELGKELQTTFAIIEDLLGLQVALLLKKSHLDATQWQQGALTLAHQPLAWGVLPQHAVYYISKGAQPLLEIEKLRATRGYKGELAQDYSTDEQRWRQLRFPILSANGTQLGQLALFRDITQEKSAVNHSIAIFYALTAGLFVLLLVLLRFALRRLNRQIVIQQQALKDSEGSVRGYTGTIQDITDSVNANNANNAKRVQEKEFRHLLESTAAIPWRMDPASLQFTYVGPRAERESGYSLDDWLSPGFCRDHINPQDLYKLGLCRRETKQGRSYSFEFRLKDTHQNDIWFSTDAAVNEQGQLQGFMFNVTTRRRQELLLREIAAGLACGVGEDFLFALCRQIHKIFRCEYVLVARTLSPEQLQSIVLLQRDAQQAPRIIDLRHTPFQQTLLQQSCAIPSELASRFPDDATTRALQIESYVGESLTNSEGEVIGLIAMLNKRPFEDVGFAKEVLSIFAARAAIELEQSQTKQRLEQKELESREVLNAMVDSVITIDEHGTVLAANNATQTVFGWSPAELTGKNIKVLMPDDVAKQHDGFLQRYIDGGKARIIGTNRELTAMHKTHAPVPIRLSISELPSEVDGPRRFIGTCVDITALRQQEEMLQRSQKMDALGKLTGGVAHDYNNILGIIMGYAELIDQMLDDSSPCKDANKEVYQAAKRGARLARKLLSFSRKQPKQTGICNLNDRIVEQQQVLQTSLTSLVRLNLDCADNLWPVNLDTSDFDDALLNMVINAQHAMEGNKGEVDILTANVTLNKNEANALGLLEGDYVIVCVSDDGKGMDKATMTRVFEPFFTTKGESGTGLGLSSVYGFVQRCNGIVNLESQIGKGTRFTLYFPRAGGDIELNANEISQTHSPEGRGHILIVDDEVALAHMAAQFLQSKGYRTVYVDNPHKALEALAEQSFDLVFSDVIMPLMDGFELAANIKQRYSAMPVLLTSGYTESRQKKASQHYDILSKPYSLSELQSRIQAVLSEGATETA